MYVRAYKHARLMEESEWRVEVAASSNLPEEVLASQVLKTPLVYRRWMAEHNRLLQRVGRAVARGKPGGLAEVHGSESGAPQGTV